jgi:hypothetical protein
LEKNCYNISFVILVMGKFVATFLTCADYIT